MYRADGPQELRPVGEVEFVQGLAAASASGLYGPCRAAAAIVGRANLNLGDQVQPVLEALHAASPNRLRGIRHTVTWDPHPEIDTPDRSRTPDPHPRRAVTPAASMSVARSAAVTGSVQPVSGSNVIVDVEPAEADGVEHVHRAALGAQRAQSARRRSVRVDVTSTAPGASMTRPASHPVLPVRGPPKTRRRPRSRTTPSATRPGTARTATSATGSRHRRPAAQPGQRRPHGRGAAAHRQRGGVPGDVQRGGDAGLAAAAPHQRVTTAADRDNRCHPTPAATSAARGRRPTTGVDAAVSTRARPRPARDRSPTASPRASTLSTRHRPVRRE